MRFLVDAQLPPALCDWLIGQGHSADHVLLLRIADAEDEDVWRKACELHAHLITKDEDFVFIRERATSGPAVLWLRIGNATNRSLITWLANSFEDAIQALEGGAPIVEIK